jgi:hypothetical protein
MIELSNCEVHLGHMSRQNKKKALSDDKDSNYDGYKIVNGAVTIPALSDAVIAVGLLTFTTRNYLIHADPSGRRTANTLEFNDRIKWARKNNNNRVGNHIDDTLFINWMIAGHMVSKNDTIKSMSEKIMKQVVTTTFNG